MGVYEIECSDCSKLHQWLSDNLDQRCEECFRGSLTSKQLLKTDGPEGADVLINCMIGDFDFVITKYIKILREKEISPKDAYYILMMALAERTALQIYGAKKQLATTTDEMLDIFNDAVRQILERAEVAE